ncbi:MAG: alcohol dehydrogenase catalytic domain-containing protein [Thermomicrobiales bacterium]|nr:alcohol dehydrogenase catalytic domain-containing protein [Thermomicrobiales bacterium]
MRAIVFETPGELRVADIPEPAPAATEVVLAVEAAGLCGSDIHAYLGAFPAPFPYVPGHEVAGRVVQVGGDLDPALIGRRFVVHPLRPCGACDNCHAGRINFCDSLHIYGGDLPGGFAERLAVQLDRLLEIPAHLSSEEAAFAEPLACVLHGLDRIGVAAGDRVLIIGAGSIGLLLMQACLARGAAGVTVADIVHDKLSLVRALGGTPLPLPGAIAPRSFDLVIDATGSPVVVAGLLEHVRDGGRVLYFGVCPPDATIAISPFELFRRELTIAGCFSLAGELEPALRLLADGAVNVASMISDRQPLEGLTHVLGQHEGGGHGSSAIKTLILPAMLSD